MDNTGGSDAEIFSHCSSRSAFPVDADRRVAGAKHTDHGNTGYWSGCCSGSFTRSRCCGRTGSGARRNAARNDTGDHNDSARDHRAYHHDRARDRNQKKEIGQDDPAAGDRQVDR
jgi:hypothetical protein